MIANFFYSYGLFSLKLVTLLVLVLIFVVFLLSLIKGAKDLEKDENSFEFINLFDLFKKGKTQLEKAIFDFDDSLDDKAKKKAQKLKLKNQKSDDKKAQEDRLKRLDEAQKNGEFCPQRLFVIDFDGDVHAKGQKDLTKKINLILSVADENDEVIVNLTSPGGVVNGYGLCAAQLERIRDKKIRLVVCVDEVAASGGYMMACTASKIVAAPFAYIGSIGVIAQMPNFNKVLKKHEIEYEQITAGKYKRTLTMFGQNTDEARDKFKQELNLIHDRFKGIVSKYRPFMDIDNIASGEYWLAQDALELKLVDEISTFDAYLQKRLDFTKVCAIKIGIKAKANKSLKDKLKKFLSAKTWTKALKEQVQEVICEDNQGQIK